LTENKLAENKFPFALGQLTRDLLIRRDKRYVERETDSIKAAPRDVAAGYGAGGV
jgi:hypothetical protein